MLVTHKDVVDILRKSGSIVQLVIARKVSGFVQVVQRMHGLVTKWVPDRSIYQICVETLFVQLRIADNVSLILIATNAFMSE